MEPALTFITVNGQWNAPVVFTLKYEFVSFELSCNHSKNERIIYMLLSLKNKDVQKLSQNKLQLV